MASTAQEVRDREQGFELRTIEDRATERTHRDEAVALHPVDQGFHAWLFVASATGLELLVWGFPLW